jgi:ABC-type nitrate/sulfonate/bicarbonate transport system permease component
MTASTDVAAEPTRRPARPVRPARPALARWYAEHQRLVLGIVGILMVLVPWEIVVRLGLVKEILVSSPSAVAKAFVTEFSRDDIWKHIWASFRVWAVGYAVASLFGILLGLAAGWYRRAGLIAVPWLNFVFAAPDLAFVPIFILWFGLGFVFKVWVVFLGVIIYVSLNTIAGVHATEGRFLAVARTYGASPLMTFRTIVLPGSVPYIMTGLRVASGRAIVGVLGAEFISANEGLGFLISIAGSTLQTSRVFVGIILLATFGVLLNEVLGRIERRFDAWRREVHG